MEKPEIRHIRSFLSDVYGGIWEGNSPMPTHLGLTELYKLLMDETFRTKHQRQKVVLTNLGAKGRIIALQSWGLANIMPPPEKSQSFIGTLTLTEQL